MTFEVTIRHTEHLPYGDGTANSRYAELVEADTEEEVFSKVRFTGIWDGIDHIDAHYGMGRMLMFHSVDTGHPEFPSDALREHDVAFDPGEDQRLG